MKRSASKLLSGASSAKAARVDKAHPEQSKTILDNAIAVFQRLTDLGSATFNVRELSAAGQIGIQIVEIINVRPKTPFFDERNRRIHHEGRYGKRKQIGRNTSNS
jgi:hypothetical protein